MSDEIVPFRGGIVPFGRGGTMPHGTARWMPPELAKEKGLYDGDTGFLFARGSLGAMRYGRGKHAIVCAPSRSGKGVSFVIPNLLTWMGSCFAIDPKGELAHFTAQRRRNMGQRVHVLDPCGVSGQPTTQFNPIDWLQESHDLDTDLRRIVAALTPDNSGTARFWNHSARDLLLGILMYQIAIPDEPKNLGRTYELLNLPQGQWEKLLANMRNCDGGSPSLNGKVREKGEWFKSLHAEHKEYHRGTLQYHLAWLGVSAARTMVEKSDFDIRDIKNGKATIYACIPALDSETYEGFTRVLTTLAIQAVSMRLVPAESKEPPILLMLDEFATTVGRMRVFDDAYTNIAGYGGRFAIILQTIDQLQSLFPERQGNQSWKTVYENAGLRLFFDAQDDTAEFVSQKLGQTTYDQIAPIGGSRQVGGPLLRPNDVSFPVDDLGRHIPDAVFAFVEGWPPIRARRLFNYRDPEFLKLHNPKAIIPELKPTGLTEWQQAQRGYGAGVGEKNNPQVAKRSPLPDPPAVSKEEVAGYLRKSGWGSY